VATARACGSPAHSAATSSAARPTLNTASSRATVRGSRARACSVDTRTSGTHSTTPGSPCGTSRCQNTPPRVSRTDTVRPPSQQATALSGWPSRSTLSCTCEAKSRGSPKSRLAAAIPATRAAALLPNPRSKGIRLVHRKAKATPPAPARLAKACAAWYTALPSSHGSTPSPSPRTSTRGSSDRVASTSFRKPRARARQSNPGPRLAEVAGTVTRTRMDPPDNEKPSGADAGECNIHRNPAAEGNNRPYLSECLPRELAPCRRNAGRLPGVIGPVPRPLWIRVLLFTCPVDRTLPAPPPGVKHLPATARAPRRPAPGRNPGGTRGGAGWPSR
jgi:hypothetical protein